MRVGFCQFAPQLGEPQANLEKGLSLIRQLTADLIVLPELSNSGYYFRGREDLVAAAEEIPGGPTTTAWLRESKQTGACIIGGLAEKSGDVYYNAAVAVGPDGVMAQYRKSHLFGGEDRWFRPGDTGFSVFRVGAALVGIMICFDWAFPESARVLALQGAELICHPSNIVTNYALPGMIARSVENRVFSVTANRIGVEGPEDDRLTYVGRSQIIAPDGRILTRAGDTDECVGAADFDPTEARDKRLAGFTDLFRSRRPELYTKLLAKED